MRLLLEDMCVFFYLFLIHDKPDHIGNTLASIYNGLFF